ncbi:MAG: glucuronate isomerase [Oscillospiraceae bacterium]|nr:glucuronate isomerase [Oscillospiraceae bacterium]
MKNFMDDNFLLNTKTSEKLYHDYAAAMPVIDYHCHIDPREIYENRCFENLTQAWLEGDHYKWRLLRANGVSEDFITGGASDREKFQKYAEALPRAISNPLYHWTHLELKRYLDIDTPLSGSTADEIWSLSLDRLSSDRLSVRNIIKSSNVKVIGTTDDPADSLEWHMKLKNDKTFEAVVVPTFRPDRAMNIEKPDFAEYIGKLGEAAGVSIKNIDDVKTALKKRLEFFVELGCRASDHGFDYIPFCRSDGNTAAKAFQNALNGGTVGAEEAKAYKTELMLFIGRELNRHRLVMQLHFGAVRNVNRAMYDRLGADTGYDCVGVPDCGGLIRFLDALEQSGELPKTVLYSLNPNDNAMLCSIAGCFQGTSAAGKIQHGSAWWFNDTLIGMKNQLKTLASISLLGNFIGMTTDSRSFLSYPRHEYFRRILCGIIGKWVDNGEYPNDIEMLGRLVQDISYNNANKYFDFP